MADLHLGELVDPAKHERNGTGVTVTTADLSTHGVIVQLRDGPQLYFGQMTQLRRKWDAALAVLQDRSSAGASYIDLSDPQRPAPGTAVSQKQATVLGLATGVGAGSAAGG